MLDEASLARARALVGLKGYVTNIPAELLPAPEVISSYHDLWHVEQPFRMSKTDPRARPMFHHTKNAIEAHLTIVSTALALALAREAQNRTALAIRNLVRQLHSLRSATISINGTVQTIHPAINDHQKALLDAIKQPRTHALSDYVPQGQSWSARAGDGDGDGVAGRDDRRPVRALLGTRVGTVRPVPRIFRERP